MNKRTTKILIIGLLTIGVLSFGYYKIDEFFKVNSCLDQGGQWNDETNECEFNSALLKSDSPEKLNGYNELANEEDRDVYAISAYNTDQEDIENIKRPDESQLINPTIDTLLLFRIWTSDPDGPHADFHITKNDFYVVDYDGDGSMPNILNKDTLTIYYNDFIQKGRIVKVTKDILTIKWDEANGSTDYLVWKD